ncbi:methylenetetrahydrofolate reductase [Breoghania sp. JC706]|uniref:methylenetetrahydrofolate reductase n=1 Tax=Breoghania sp. JC706 TaxID=3117732 RepID=UPI003009AD45
MTEIRSEAVGRMRRAATPEKVPLWLRGWSVDATPPTVEGISSLGGHIDAGSEIYLSSLPRVAHADQIAAAVAVRRAGFEPVLHLAARKFSSEQELADHLGAAGEGAGVRKAVVVAGDIDAVRGPFGSSIDLIGAPAFASSAIVEVGLGGYPEGHPFVQSGDLASSLAAKIAAVQAVGMVPFVVSQFSFDAARILRWLAWLRTFAPATPVKLGVASPTRPETLMKIALRCWVDMPSSGLKAAPDHVIADLDEGLKAHHEQGPVQLHLYSFGALLRTAKWATAATRTAELAREA